MRYSGVEDGCPVIPHVDTPRACNRCGRRLKGRRSQWCSADCEDWFRANHNWTTARHYAKKRDRYQCVRCGSDGRAVLFVAGSVVIPTTFTTGPRRYERLLEVNHIHPREGQGYGWGCAHHLDGLETLCRRHHQMETNKQAAKRRLREAMSL